MRAAATKTRIHEATQLARAAIATWYRGESAPLTYPAVLAALCVCSAALLNLAFPSSPDLAKSVAGNAPRAAAIDVLSESQPLDGSVARFVNPFAAREVGGSVTRNKPPADAKGATSRDAQDRAEPAPLPGVRLPISGRVLDQRGFGVAEMPVVATAERGSLRRPDQIQSRSQPAHRTITNDDGTYLFAALAGGEYTVRTVPVGGRYTRAKVAVAAGDVADLVVTSLRDIEVHGSVSDATGRPVPGAWVAGAASGLDEAAATDAYGRFSLRTTVQDDPDGFVLRARCEGYLDSVVEIDAISLADATPIQADIVMDPAELVRVSGMLTDVHGVPFAGRTVNLQSQRLRRSYRASTDAGGTFVFENAEASTDYQLLVRGVEHYQEYVQRNVAITGERLQLTIVLEPENPSALSASNKGT